MNSKENKIIIPEKCKYCKFIRDYTKGPFIRDPHYCCELVWLVERLEYRIDPDIIDEKCPLKNYDDVLDKVLKLKEKENINE